MYIQTPGVGAPGPEALSKEWSASPLARRGALRPSLWVVYAQREGTAATPACSPNLKRRC